MALIKCSECGGQMSDRATECPHCGCPIEIIKQSESEQLKTDISRPQSPKNRGKFIIIGLVVALLGVGAFLCVKNDVFAYSTLKITPEFIKALERYDQVDAFSEGMAAVRRDGKWGYINLKGEEVIPCQFSDAFPPGQFSEGVACVVDERSDADKKLWNKRVGFINKKGEWVITGDYFTDSPTFSPVWEEYSHKLPSFKDGKCAVWNTAVFSLDGDGTTESGWSKEYEANKIILIDKNGKSEEVADSIGYKMSYYRPYNVIAPYKDIAQCQEKKVVYDDYAINIARDTTKCDNGARLVTWQILDANSYPYQTEEKTVQYFIDKQGNSTLSSAQTEAMEQHLNGLVASVTDRHNEQLRRQAEEERLNALREHPEKLFESLARNHIWHAYGCAKLSSLRYNCEYVISFRPETERSGQCSYITWEDNGKHNTYSAAFSSDYCNYVIKGDIIEFYWRVKKWTDHYQIIFDENTEGIILKDLSSSLGQFTMIPKTKELIPKSFEY